MQDFLQYIPFALVTVTIGIIAWFLSFRSDVTNSLTTIKENHLTHIQASGEKTVELAEQQLQTLIRIETKLDGLNNGR